MKQTQAEALYNDDAFVQFYDLENGWGDDTRYCAELASTAHSILDLGCGTGLLATHLATGGKRRVVGVDHAAAMLRAARARPQSETVRWVEGDVRNLDLGQTFELVVMTGHAFQCLLLREDRAALFATIRKHLAPGGHFIFDSRNPAGREWLEWNETDVRRLQHSALGPVTAWNTASQNPATGLVHYDTYYRLQNSGKLLSTRCALAFPPREEIDDLLSAAGLRVKRWLGSWLGEDWTPNAPEIIPLGTLKD